MFPNHECWHSQQNCNYGPAFCHHSLPLLRFKIYEFKNSWGAEPCSARSQVVEESWKAHVHPYMSLRKLCWKLSKEQSLHLLSRPSSRACGWSLPAKHFSLLFASESPASCIDRRCQGDLIWTASRQLTSEVEEMAQEAASLPAFRLKVMCSHCSSWATHWL